MKSFPRLSRKHIAALFLVASFFALVPYVYQYIELGSQAPKLPVGVYNQAGYYYDRMEEVKDGYPFLGNPYFIEHRNELPPAFFLADWFAAIPLLLGVPLMPAILIDLLLWSFFFLVLTSLLFQLLDVSLRWSFWGSLFVYCEVYLLLIRPVSMQIVFPFFLVFLIAYLIWLKEPENRKNQTALALAAAFTAYIYTYAWQIVIVALGLTPIFFFFTGRRGSLKAFFRMFGAFALLSLPLVLYTMKQVAHPLYWETIHRIGLINTHVPASAVFSVSIWVFVFFCFWVFFSRYDDRIGLKKEHALSFSFFVLTGAAMVAVASSNIISGKDLELPQHIGRFVTLWFGIATVYTCYFLSRQQKFPQFSPRAFATGTLLVAVIFFGNVAYFFTFGPGLAFDEQKDFALFRKAEGFDGPLAWLRENVKEPAVIWVDPNAPLREYVVMMTQHYLLFQEGGELHLVAQNELEERFLVSHYFALSRADLIDDYQSYAGVGNAQHEWRAQNRKVKLCRIFHFDRLGYACGELTDRESYIGAAYFTGLYEKYQQEIRPNIIPLLKKYHVAYIMRDSETDRPEFRPELISGTKLVYSDGRFFIYSFAP